jgi:hypothetical protein
MWNRKCLGGWLGLVAAILLSGCTYHGSHLAIEHQTGESVVLAGEEPANLAFAPLASEPVTVRSTYRDGLPQTVHYLPGRDYLLEASGQIRRTPGSRIPDFSTISFPALATARSLSMWITHIGSSGSGRR